MRNLKQALGRAEQIQIKVHKGNDNYKNAKENHVSSKWGLVVSSDDSGESSDNSTAFINLLEMLYQAQQAQQIQYQQLVMNILENHKIIRYQISEKEGLKTLEKLLKDQSSRFPIEIKYIIMKIQQTIKQRLQIIEHKDANINHQLQAMQKRLFKKITEQNLQKQIGNKNKQRSEENINKLFLHKKIKMKQFKEADYIKNDGSSSQDSGEAKLSKLLNSVTIQNQVKRSNDDQRQTNEGYSFSAIMNASSAVKPRQTKILHKQCNLQFDVQTHEEDSDRTDQKDQAFIFFRPKKMKK